MLIDISKHSRSDFALLQKWETQNKVTIKAKSDQVHFIAIELKGNFDIIFAS